MILTFVTYVKIDVLLKIEIVCGTFVISITSHSDVIKVL